MKNLLIATLLAPMLSFGAIAARAQSADKLILVVCQPDAEVYTHVFENRHVSQFLNKHFVIEQQTAHHGRGGYEIYNQQGELVHRVANDKYPYELAVKIKRGLDPNTQYYTLLTRFEKGERTAEVLTNLVIGASDAGDLANAPRVMESYLSTLPAEPTEADLRFVAKHTARSSDPGFAFLYDRLASVDRLAEILFEEAFVAQLADKKADAAAIAAQLKNDYPAKALAQHIDRMPIEFLEMREDWEGLQETLPNYLQQYGKQLSPEMLAYYKSLPTT